MSSKKPHLAKPVSQPAQPETVSVRWLLTALAIVIPGAAFCAWAVLCLLFWQGSWQLLYHPLATVTRTPTAVGVAFDAVGFDPSDTGAPQMQGWWIPAANARWTVLFLHGQDGNLGNTVDDLALLHGAGVNVLAFDYRGYGQSSFIRPSEARWREDAESALLYLTATRHVEPHSIVLMGSALGANLALEIAAAHPELAGVVLESPLDSPRNAIFADPRAKLVPARLLVSDRFDMNRAADTLRVSSLWYFSDLKGGADDSRKSVKAFEKITAPKVRVWGASSSGEKSDFGSSFKRWLDDLGR